MPSAKAIKLILFLLLAVVTGSSLDLQAQQRSKKEAGQKPASLVFK